MWSFVVVIAIAGTAVPARGGDPVDASRRPVVERRSGNEPAPPAEMLLDLDLLREADLTKQRDLLHRLKLLERLQLLESLRALEAEPEHR